MVAGGEAAHASMMHRNADRRNRQEETSSGLSDMQRQIDSLEAQNVALKTSNLSLQSESEDLHKTSGRLQLALPVVCGVMSVLTVLASLVASSCMFYKQVNARREADPLSPPRRLSRAGTSTAANCGSPTRGLLSESTHGTGDCSPNGRSSSPLAARSPFGDRGVYHAAAPQSPGSPSARGTLLGSAESPKLGVSGAPGLNFHLGGGGRSTDSL
mmetsp:Transcript_48393/g.155282  ORF Transcript_48393/g.155282 Transcript_48393/m.155282 type:complete len:214 (-) Transcript_48393:260-901(-)